MSLLVAMLLTTCPYYATGVPCRSGTDYWLRVYSGLPSRVNSSTAAPPLIEFATASGVGMGAACACTTPTTISGASLVFTRASTGWCTKGNETASIVNGDLVECAVDQPRVMPGGVGTGGLGLSVWDTRTNAALRSQEFDNAVWTKIGSTAPFIPVVTANFADGPCGTPSASCGAADRLVTPALASTANYSLLIQDVIASAGATTAGFYIKGNGTTGSLQGYLAPVSAFSCFECAYNPTTWTWCGYTKTTTGGSTSFGIGTYIDDALGSCGGSDTTWPAQDVLIWQADYQLGTSRGPPITTAGTAVARAVEAASLPITLPATGSISWASTLVTPGAFIAAKRLLSMYFDVNNEFRTVTPSTGATSTAQSVVRIGGTSSATTTVATMAVDSVYRVAAYYDNATANRAVCIDGTCVVVNGALTIASGTPTGLHIGNSPVVTPIGATLKNICVDSTAAGCP